MQKTNDTWNVTLPSKFGTVILLGTRLFAQCLCHRRQQGLCARVQRAGCNVREQVPKYSDATNQVPYNQRLGQCPLVWTWWLERLVLSERFSENGGQQAPSANHRARGGAGTRPSTSKVAGGVCLSPHGRIAGRLSCTNERLRADAGQSGSGGRQHSRGKHPKRDSAG